MLEHKNRNKRNFYEILLRNEFNSEGLAILAAHLCWKNLEMSRKFGKILVRFYNKISERELMPSLVSLQYYMTL